MTPLLCASPVILDQSFPRDDSELLLVADALGELEGHLQKDTVHLILTADLRAFVEAFDWTRTGPYPLLNDIFRLLNQWFLQPHDRLVGVNVSEVENYKPHPLPRGTEKQGLVEIWSDEVGRMLVLHDACCTGNEFFVGVACVFAFAGEDVGEYDNPSNQRVFPLVGPDTIDQLADAYEWDVPSDVHRKHVGFDDAHKNCMAIGATRVDSPSGGSHYRVIFEGRRPWVLDPNTDPIPERFLRELVGITGYPIAVIKTVLINGKLPPKVLRFEKVTVG